MIVPAHEPSAPSDPPRLHARSISKAFPGVQALRDVSFELRAGRALLLLGANGAGKSTLMNICAGVTKPDSGILNVGGEPAVLHSPHDANRKGIAAVFQELSLAPNLSVGDNMFLGREPRTRLGLLDRRAIRRDAETLLARLRLSVSPDTLVSALRVGQQQVVEIARALSVDAKVMIFDEPTSALSAQETGLLLEIISELKSSGVAIAYITHKFEELGAIGDDVLVMRDGQVVAEAPLTELTHREIVRLMAGQEAGASTSPLHSRTPGAEALRVEGLQLEHPTRKGERQVSDVSFSVGHGEVLGIFGLMGAGRTELLETIYGAHPGRGGGSVAIDGAPLAQLSPSRAIAMGLALAPEDRQRDGLILNLSARENAGLTCEARSARWGWLRRQDEKRRLDPIFERMGVRAGSLDQPVRTLSGGNQQKVILAKWLAMNPAVLLLDEPTRGIDIHARHEIYGLIDQLAHEGFAVVLVSSELPEILRLSDRIIVMCEGRITAEYTRAEAAVEKLLMAAVPRPKAESSAC